MSRERRRITLRFGDFQAPVRELPAGYVGEKLAALQALVHALGVGPAPVRGKALSALRDQLGLVLVAVSPAEGAVVVELPEFQPSLFARDDVGLRALERVTSTLAWIAERDLSEIESLHPDPAARRRTLKAARALAPDLEDELRVGVSTALGDVELTGQVGRFLDPLLAEPEKG